MSLLRRVIPLLALLTLITVVGHDLLMAADAHQGTGPVTVHASSSASHVHGHHAEHDAHAIQGACTGLEAARQGTGWAVDLDGPGAIVTPLQADLALQPGPLVAWSIPPGDPPDVRRAFLQVYLN